ncbi:MAG: PIN domain-containing protein [Firmicutes bacterium]|nr:PIN domain-containing protein [Bacillota bacterium]
MIADRFTVILDANVLYPFTTRDVLLTLARAGMFRARWSETIVDEWVRSLLSNRPDLEEPIRQTVVQMVEKFPQAIVTGFEPLIAGLQLPDANDRHVLAAAIEVGAHQIVTSNTRDFPASALEPHGISATQPDDFIAGTIELYPDDAVDALRIMRERYNSPPVGKDDLLGRLVRSNLPKTAALLRPHIESL